MCSFPLDAKIPFFIGLVSTVFFIVLLPIWISSLRRNEIFGSNLQKFLLFFTAMGSLTDAIYLFGCCWDKTPLAFKQIVLTFQFLMNFTLTTYLVQWMFRLFTFSERLSWPLVKTMHIAAFWGFVICNMLVYLSSIIMIILGLTGHCPNKCWPVIKSILGTVWYMATSVLLMYFNYRLYLTFRKWDIIISSASTHKDWSISYQSDYDDDDYKIVEPDPHSINITTISMMVSGGDRFLEYRLRAVGKFNICYIFCLVIHATTIVLEEFTDFGKTITFILYYVFGRMLADVAVIMWMNQLPQTTPTDTPVRNSLNTAYTPPLGAALRIPGQHNNISRTDAHSLNTPWTPSSMKSSPEV